MPSKCQHDNLYTPKQNLKVLKLTMVHEANCSGTSIPTLKKIMQNCSHDKEGCFLFVTVDFCLC